MHHHYIINSGKAITSLKGYLLLFTSYDLAERFCRAMNLKDHTIHKTLTENEALSRSFNFYKQPVGKGD